jgi:DNA-binding MarR family transcriptional regulator
MNLAVRDTTKPDDIAFGEIGTSLGFLLRLAQVRAFDGFFNSLGQLGLKPGEFTVLWVIGLNPQVKQGVIARKLRIKPAHMTKLVQRAVDAELVKRTVPDDDRRSVHLSLTTQGESFIAENKPAFLNVVASENTTLEDEEFEMLVHLLRKLNGLENTQ